MVFLDHLDAKIPEKYNDSTAVRRYILRDLKQFYPGLRMIGSGCYGKVYGAKGLDVVFKICQTDDNEAYLSYVNEVVHMKEHNPYTPLIHGIRHYCKGKRGVDELDHFVVAMERLRWAKDKKERDMLNGIARWFDAQFDEYRAPLNEITNDKLGVHLTIPAPLVELMDLLERAQSNSGDAWWDFHSGNFMLRGEQVVVIDPIG
jgi:hypothetical protein